MSKRPFLVSLLLALGLHAAALAGTFQQGTATRTYDRGALAMDVDGRMRVRVDIKNAGGRVIDHFEVIVPVSGAVIDGDSNQLAANVPTGIANARTQLLSAIDTAIDNAAAAGKFAR